MPPKIFIDGQSGTTGLRIQQWLASRNDLQLLTICDDRRKDPQARREQIASAEVAILCLADAQAREAAAWAAQEPTRLIDASTAHRVSGDWVYGLPELNPIQRESIRSAKQVSNPGCYASACTLLVRPLIDNQLISPNAPITIHGLSGYSGGGRKMIKHWEDPKAELSSLIHDVPYAHDRVHKHIPEIMLYAKLQTEPQFVPAVGPFRGGLRVQVPLHAAMLGRNIDGHSIWKALDHHYRNEPFVKVTPLFDRIDPDEKIFNPQACNDTNRIELSAFAHPSGHVILMAVLDNLGKGACGMAIQSLNLMLGLPEETGLPQ